MSPRYVLLLGILLVVSFGVTPAPAEEPGPIPVTAGPMPEPDLPGPGCINVYTSVVGQNTAFGVSGDPDELLEDVHIDGLEEGGLCSFDMWLLNASDRGTNPMQTTTEIRFYENTSTDDPPGAVLAGPFEITLDPGFSAVVHVDALSGMVQEHMWVGMTTPGGELLRLAWRTADPPSVGTSHDLFYIRSIGTRTGPGPQDIPYNFYLVIDASPAIPAEPATWGKVKSFYR